jgi:hypothetical protein
MKIIHVMGGPFSLSERCRVDKNSLPVQGIEPVAVRSQRCTECVVTRTTPSAWLFEFAVVCCLVFTDGGGGGGDVNVA